MRVYIQPNSLKFVKLTNVQIKEISQLLDGEQMLQTHDGYIIKGNKAMLYSLLFNICKKYDIDLI